MKVVKVVLAEQKHDGRHSIITSAVPLQAMITFRAEEITNTYGSYVPFIFWLSGNATHLLIIKTESGKSKSTIFKFLHIVIDSLGNCNITPLTTEIILLDVSGLASTPFFSENFFILIHCPLGWSEN